MTRPVSLIFVCWGNICRSPMGERVAEKWLEEAALDAVVTSAGVSSEESGHPIDRRAQRVLTDAGYRPGGHRAHLITADEIAAADLVLAFEPLHLARLRQTAPTASHLALVTDFDPDAAPGSGIDDPWYGDLSGFGDTLAAIEAAMPGIITEVRKLRK